MGRSESTATRLLEPGLRRILAPNPSPMTYHGTNTYILGTGDVAVIDPGPASETHLHAIMAALEPGEQIGTILVTHAHLDHSPLARPLSQKTGAVIHAAGDATWGRRPIMTTLAASGDIGGGEGVDDMFKPDVSLRDGDVIDAPWGKVEVLHTPGHMANHVSFAWNGALFSGDLVMGWSTSLVSPPDGDMTAFFASLRRLATRGERVYYPGHGEPVENPQERVRDLIEHRLGREAAILAHLTTLGPVDVPTLTRSVYTDVAAHLLPAAERNVLAHLIDLIDQNTVTSDGPLANKARFAVR